MKRKVFVELKLEHEIEKLARMEIWTLLQIKSDNSNLHFGL